MPLMPNMLERVIFFKMNEGPGPMMELIGALGYKAVSVSVKLGVFEALAAGPMTVDRLATKLEVSRRGLSVLLAALEGLGYVTVQDGSCANTAMTARWMVGSSPDCVAGLFGHFDDMLERWAFMDESIRRGEPALDGNEWFRKRPERWHAYHDSMRIIANLVSGEVISKVKLPKGAKKLLDMGGSHGLYSIRFCRKYPGLTAVVLDLEQAREVAEETIAGEAMSDRVVFRAGDFLTDDLGGPHDAALLFNVIRMFKPDQATDVFRKTAGALVSGGRIVVMDQLASGMLPSRFSRANAQLINLELFGALKGETHTGESIAKLLGDAGYRDARIIALRRSPGTSLVTAVRP
jgi:predicted O-methyltransferase YrrM